MFRGSSSLALLAVLVLGACSDAPEVVAPDPDAAASRAAADRAPIYIVMFRDGVDAAAAAREIARSAGVTPRFVWSVARGFSAAIPEARLDAVRVDPRVAMVSPDRVVTLPDPVGRVGAAAPPWCPDPDDPRCPDDDSSDDGGSGSQVVPWGITRVGGPGVTASGRAWVIDTGVDLDHGDLTVDPGCSANFAKGKDSPDDGHGHGTHVAGTIAAIDNGQDVVGVAPGTTVCAVRVLDNSGSGTWEGVINGVNYVGSNGTSGDVANMSLGGSASGSEPNALEQAILNATGKGILFAIAAGNSGEDASNHTPARIGDNSTKVYTISAVDSNDCLASWSNFGSAVDNAEPGVSILSLRKGGGTTTMSGTSMAAPHTSGILLLGSVNADGSACADPDAEPDDPIGTL